MSDKVCTNTTLLTQLIHKGVIVPSVAEPRGLVLTIRGLQVPLSPKAEEMALAWAKKHGTPYVADRVFQRNFLADFSAELGIDPPLSLEEVDFAPAIRIVEAEREAKAQLSKEERRALAAERKAQRLEQREEYGYAMVNGEKAELGTYMVEPSGIFMGRGQHPLRGRWKEGAQQKDITLNVIPKEAAPPGEWEIVEEPNCLWIARWKDKLSGKMKYIWLGDAATLRQEREEAKYDKSVILRERLPDVRAHIDRGLEDVDAKRRMVATACFLIDRLGLRVGDEKDPDEADTVGATTLRCEHVQLHPDGHAEFRFLGKDSVEWHKRLELPETVRKNLEELIAAAEEQSGKARGKRNRSARNDGQLFPGVGSHDVNAFLAEVLPGISAKVFRTYHATVEVEESLAKSKVKAQDPDYEKWKAVSLANLAAAEFCNHTRQAGAAWKDRKARFEEREKRAAERRARSKEQVEELRKQLRALRKEAAEKIAASKPKQKPQREASYEKKIERAQARLAAAQEGVKKAQLQVGKIKAEALVASKRHKWNLTTSLKSYIDPRVFHRWGQQVDYDVLERYYSATLAKKFSWVRNNHDGDG